MTLRNLDDSSIFSSACKRTDCCELFIHIIHPPLKDGTRSEEQRDENQVESYVAQRYIENPYLISGTVNPYLMSGTVPLAFIIVEAL